MSNPDNPYLGLRPYTEQEQDRFFGRNSEIHILTDKILAHRLTLLVAASGVGKSSLLQAGVMPALRATGMADLVYHNDWAVNPDADLKTSLVKHLIKKQRVTADYQADFTLPLAEFIRLHSLLCEGSLVILLDQFEEFFYYQRFSQQREPFIQELAGAIQDPQSAGAFVFAMREDFAMELQAFKPWFKGIFDNVYRIEKLDLNAAKEAICKPLDNIGFSLEPELLEQLLQDLGQRELKERLELPQQSDRQTELFVEPPHLQIVCQQLWLQARTNADRQIKLGHYQSLGKTQGILTGYFRQKMALLKREQLRLASKAFDHLVSQHGTKRSFPLVELAELLDENESALQQTLDLLQEAVILRRIQRNGSYWYELYHDIFAKSINDWNQIYKAQQLRWKAVKGLAFTLFAGGMLTVAYDGYSNHRNRYLQLGPETVSDRVEVYQGQYGSWDLLRQQKFLYETDYVRWDIEADKRFQQQALAELDQTEAAQIGQLPLTQRLPAFARVGLFNKADTVSKALHDSKDEALLNILARQQHKIRTLASFNTLDNLYRKHSGKLDGIIGSLVAITPQSKRLAVIDKLLRRETQGGSWEADEKIAAAIKILRRLNVQAAIPQLVDLLEDKEGTVRESAVQALGQLNAQAAIPKLVGLLGDEKDAVRESAVQALGQLNAQAAIPKLVDLLDYKEDTVRKSAVQALGLLNAKIATPKLIALLDYKNDEESSRYSLSFLLYNVRESAARALGRLNAQAAIPKLVGLLNDEEYNVRESAVQALGQLNAQAAIPKLTALLDDEDASAAEALGQLNAQAAIPKLIALLDYKKDEESGRYSLSFLLNNVRKSAARALGQLNAQAAIPKLIALLDDEEDSMRPLAAQTLGLLNAQTAIPKLVDLLKDKEDTVRQSAAEALGRLSVQAAIPTLVALLDDENDSMRQSAAEALGRLNAQAAAPALLKLLSDKDNEKRQTAALVLSRLQSQNPALAQWQDSRLAELNETNSKTELADRLAYIATPASVTMLNSLLIDTNPNILIDNLDSLTAIATIHPQWLETHIPRLVELARYKHFAVQQAAINALTQIIAQHPNQSATVSPAITEQVLQSLTGIAQDNTTPDTVRLAAIDGLGNSKTEQAAAVLLALLPNSNLQLRCSYWLGQMAYQPALAEFKQRLTELEKEKQQWRQQLLASKTQDNKTESLTAPHQDKSWQNDYLVYQYAYTIARIDSQNAGIALLNHPLYAAREAAIQALADQASGVLATKLVADLQAFTPEDLPSPRPYAAYRALDLLLQQVEFSGNQDDLAALSKLVEVEVELPMTTQQQAVNERLSWTVAELKARLDEQAGH